MPDKIKVAIGIDFGLSRIGLAVGQTITKTAGPLATITAKNGEPNWHEVTKIIHKWQPQALVIGMPIKEKETDKVIDKAVLNFTQQLKKLYSLPCYHIDERFSTREARQILTETHGKKSNQIKVDSLAACLILESWFRTINLV